MGDFLGYYGNIGLILVILIVSVAVQGKDLFSDMFFAVAYLVMSFVLIAGTKYKESFMNDMFLGLILMLSVGFLSMDVIVRLLTGKIEGAVMLKFAVVLSLDFCALNFFYLGMKYKKEYDELCKRKGSLFWKT